MVIWVSGLGISGLGALGLGLMFLGVGFAVKLLGLSFLLWGSGLRVWGF